MLNTQYHIVFIVWCMCSLYVCYLHCKTVALVLVYVVICHSTQLCSRRRHIGIHQSLNRSLYFFSCIVHPLATSVTRSHLCTVQLIKVHLYISVACSVYPYTRSLLYIIIRLKNHCTVSQITGPLLQFQITPTNLTPYE